MKKGGVNRKSLIFYGLLIAFIVLGNIPIGDVVVKVINKILIIVDVRSVQEFLKTNTQGLLIIFLMEFYFDFIKNDETQNIIRDINRLLTDEHYWKTLDKTRVVSEILRYKYGNGSTANLLSLIMPSEKRTIYTDVSVLLKLEEHINDKSFYKLKYTLSFFAPIHEFIVAFTHKSEIQEILSSRCDTINDIFVFSDRHSLNESIDSYLKNENFFKYLTEQEGITLQNSIFAHEIDTYKFTKYISKDLSRIFQDVRLVKVSIPKAIKINRFIITYSGVMNKHDHFCYWTADRPMFLRDITFDVSKINVGKEPIFFPFMNNHSAISESKNGIIFLNINNWVVKGQGAMVIW